MMEIFQTIWTALTTENEVMLNIALTLLSFVEAVVDMLLFTTLLNIKANKKSKIIYVISISIVASISRFFIPLPYTTFLNMIATFLLIKFVLKTNIVKALFALFIPIILISVLELFIFQFCLSIFNLAYESLFNSHLRLPPFVHFPQILPHIFITPTPCPWCRKMV